MKPTLTDLKSITQILIADESSYLQIRNACTDLLNFFYRVSDFDETDTVNQKHMQSAAGQAVSPEAAAVCIRDFMRTRIFMRGLKQASSTKLQANPNKAVTVLYAGTGPFATLLIPLVTIFSAGELNMLLLDINPVSIGYLNKIISYLKLEAYVLQVVEADAVTYSIPAQLQPGIILSETMMPALKTEPQVSIVANLVGQCPLAILIPEMIEINAVLYNSKHDDSIQFIHLKTLFECSKDTALKMAAQQQNRIIVFPVIKLELQQPPQPSFSRLALLTDIKVFNNHTLTLKESSLTMPQFVYNLHTIQNWPAVFNIQYHISPVAGFIISE
jgi:hypothetical protein